MLSLAAASRAWHHRPAGMPFEPMLAMNGVSRPITGEWVLEPKFDGWRAPAGPVEATRHELALEHLEDLRHIDEQMRASKRRLTDVVRASRTTVAASGCSIVGRTMSSGRPKGRDGETNGVCGLCICRC